MYRERDAYVYIYIFIYTCVIRIDGDVDYNFTNVTSKKTTPYVCFNKQK